MTFFQVLICLVSGFYVGAACMSMLAAGSDADDWSDGYWARVKEEGRGVFNGEEFTIMPFTQVDTEGEEYPNG